MSDEQILKLVMAEQVPVLAIPLSVFENKGLSALELICKYLKEEKKLGINQIAELLQRDYRTIWTTYSKANKKRKARLIISETKLTIPVSVIADRKLSVLEAIVSYLKDEFGLRYNAIASLIFRDQRNVRATYLKAKRKENAKAK